MQQQPNISGKIFELLGIDIGETFRIVDYKKQLGIDHYSLLLFRNHISFQTE